MRQFTRWGVLLACTFMLLIAVTACGSQVADSAATHPDMGQAAHTPMAAMNEVHDDAEHAVDSHSGETGSQDADPVLDDTAGEHGVSGGHGDHDSMTVAEAHGIPEDAAAVPNPVLYDAASVEAGAAIFSQTCAVCHGPEGAGDGPGAAALEPKPADLRADHVQANSDGGLFYTISEGRPGTAMPAWEETLSESQRWHLVNYIRSLVAE